MSPTGRQDPRCQLCGRMMNEWVDLGSVYAGPAVPRDAAKELRICHGNECHARAARRGCSSA